MRSPQARVESSIALISAIQSLHDLGITLTPQELQKLASQTSAETRQEMLKQILAAPANAAKKATVEINQAVDQADKVVQAAQTELPTAGQVVSGTVEEAVVATINRKLETAAKGLETALTKTQKAPGILNQPVQSKIETLKNNLSQIAETL